MFGCKEMFCDAHNNRSSLLENCSRNFLCLYLFLSIYQKYQCNQFLAFKFNLAIKIENGMCSRCSAADQR